MSLSIVLMQDVWGNIGGLVRVNHVESVVGDLEQDEKSGESWKARHCLYRKVGYFG
jgi:hypothetical protein